jgi:glycyl-tRNA synthetase
MTQPLNFQQAILKLHQFWADQGCVIWNPYNIQLGAGTGNPATLLKVLGPEPWCVAYVEPSVRPDDGRYGENPNRMQYYFQYQVILKPEPGNPQEIYLQSLEALGVNPREHDIRFVEDNWESPALGAWGLGWEVWLDGQEITQYTYFQQAGGLELNPVSVEITYGLERIVLALQGKDAAWDIEWLDKLTYSDVFLRSEIEHCKYYFEIADVDGLKQTYDVYERESKRALEAGLVIPSYDYVLKCSHLFNVLDARGAIGVTERASYFRRMRDMTRNIAKAYADQRMEMEYPLDKMVHLWKAPERASADGVRASSIPDKPADFIFEIGVEEMPAGDVNSALEQLHEVVETLFDDLRLAHKGVSVSGTPRRLVITASKLAPRQTDSERVEKGPPVARAFDEQGKPTKAAEGFARSRGVNVEDLWVQEIDGGQYVTALVREVGRPTGEVLAEALPKVIAGLTFAKAMRWNDEALAFSRPIRWLVALFGDTVIPFAYAGLASGRTTHGLRPYGSPEIELKDTKAYFKALEKQHITLDHEARRVQIQEQITKLAQEVGGRIPDDPALLDEVTNLVEAPMALRGQFDKDYLKLPREVLITVMRKHQRYFALEDKQGKLMPYFIAVRNGDEQHLDKVIAGNEHVLKARFSDATFFYSADIQKPLENYLPRLSTLTFQEKLGSMLDKNQRVAGLVEPIGKLLSLDSTDIAIVQRAAHLAKADLATQMVVELTSLQGVMGRVYALLGNYPPEVAQAIEEHWMPRNADDSVPSSPAGTLLALIDRLDSLVGLFAVGLAPKSTADPYGLRRAALGVVQILVENKLDVDLERAIEVVAMSQPVDVTPEARAQVLEFIGGRLRSYLEETDWPHDVVMAVLAEQSSNPYRAIIGIEELYQWTKRQNWEQILDNFARCVRITRPEPTRYEVKPELLADSHEKALYEAYLKAHLPDDANVSALLSAFEPIVPVVGEFFERVMVHVDDERVRHNRLGLLQAISSMQNGRADLSYLSGF